MLDDLLGRTELREEIETLEEELHHLERELEAEQERRVEAVSARQDAEERVNRLEDRIADLEGRLDRSKREETAPEFRRRTRLSPGRCATVLDRLRSFQAKPDGALTAMLDDQVPDEVQSVLDTGDTGGRSSLIRRAMPCILLAEETGLLAVALRPAVPPEPFTEWSDRFRLDHTWFCPSGSFALALVRADLFALGEYQDGDRQTFQGFESEVKADHSKGGFSQGRFERGRDEQIDAHLDRCRAAITEASADRIYVVGDGRAIGRLADLATRTATVDATGSPEPALDDAFESFWTTELVAL